MLEKIGLPPKPSLRGNNWVTDASHCQGCSAQFTFINRKHHCRRCGGIFCNSCTQQRMMLRGQGDSAVRICEPCKKLEEAARFEMRHGHKTKAGRGGSKLASKKEDEILNHILGNEDMLSDPQLKSSASCSNVKETSTQNGGDIGRSISFDQPAQALTEVGSATPEDLRQQALVEKKKYRTLKAEGKSEEALSAFKRGKELERQAGALEVYLRKRRRMVSSSSSTNDIQQSKDDSISSGENNKLPIQKSKEKDDLAAELKDLGWSDVDLLDGEKRPAVTSLEGEFSSLLGEIPRKPNKEKEVVGTDKAQVIAHKKKALELKREGKLAEAKEELKRAKILERKIEEEEFLGDAEDSDDELSALVRSMDDDKHDDFSAQYKQNINFDFDNLVGIADDDDGVDGIFEVTDEDMGDPEIASALKSLGWTEDSTYSGDSGTVVVPINRESLLTEVQSLKREALNQKKVGNTREALALLKKAKELELELQSSDSHGTDSMALGSAELQKVSVSQSAEEPFVPIKVAAENVNDRKDTGRKQAPKSKLMIQKELIVLKKKVLSLKREGKLDEAEEELKNAKVLEEQLEELNKVPPVKHPSASNKQTSNTTTIDIGNEVEVTDVTDHDMNDPTYLSLLKNLGWEEEDNKNIPSASSKENTSIAKFTGHSSVTQANFDVGTSRKSKSDIQRELLGLKRKALVLRRQGKVEEADEVLKMARLLEVQLQEFEAPIQKEVLAENSEGNASMDASQNVISFLQEDGPNSFTEDLGSKNKITVEKPVVISESVQPQIHEPTSTQANTSERESSSSGQDILAHKRKAITLKREGKLVEAKEELRQAKLLEKRLEDRSHPNTSSSDTSSSDVSSVEKKEASPKSVSKPLSGRDRFKLQQESLGHKRQALKLRREGRTEEADAEFELAKALESQLQELDAHNNTGASDNAESVDGVSVEDFLDPQLLSALNSIGLEDTRLKSQSIERPESNKSVTVSIGNASEEREQLVERIKAEKVKAVNLKRAGKQAEALDALRRAKLYEKKLQSLTSQS